MAEYAANILKTEALYYTLSRATLRDGILHLSAGGWAETEITSLQLTNLTENFRVSYIADRYCDSYTSNIRIIVYAKDADGNSYNFTFFPCDTHDNLFMQEFQIKAAAYDKLIWRIESDVVINVSLWELCPEAEDINVQTIIDGVNQSLPRLLYDYNTWPLTVEDGETTVGLITFRLLNKTDLQGHFIMSFFASDAAILTVRFYTNEIEELFAPLTYDIRKGYNSIGIPHCYLHRSAGFYSVMATAQVSAGIVTIPTRGVLYSIDGGYLAKRELDVAMDVRDLAIKQTSTAYGPEEVWLVGIDAGEILVRKRDYNEVNPNVAWKAVCSLGEGISAAIEFNGYWDLRENSYKYTIETEEDPWYFWVTKDNKLYGRLGEDTDTEILLAEEVTLVHACRGYSAREYPEFDQGLVVVYLKQDGSAYYRTYSYNRTRGMVIWEIEQPILPGEFFEDINVHRLNDYRLSIELSNGNHNIWLYTTRTYVAQSVPPEYAYVQGFIQDEGMYPNFVGYYANDVIYPEIQLLQARDWSEPNGNETKYFWEFVFDHAIFGAQQLFSYYARCTFTGIQYPFLESFEPDYELGITTIVVSSDKPPLGWITTITIHWDEHLRYLDNGVIYPLVQDITGQLDHTVYIPLNLHDEGEIVQQFVPNVQYKTVTYPTLNLHDEGSIVQSFTKAFAYKEITYPTLALEDAHTLNNIVSTTLSYLDTRYDPI